MAVSLVMAMTKNTTTSFNELLLLMSGGYFRPGCLSFRISKNLAPFEVGLFDSDEKKQRLKKRRAVKSLILLINITDDFHYVDTVQKCDQCKKKTSMICCYGFWLCTKCTLASLSNITLIIENERAIDSVIKALF